MKGSCLCGEIEYEARALAGQIVHCHCRKCRKAHAASYATTARVDRPDFQWLKGTSSLGSYESSPGKLRHFCKQCGSQLMAEWVHQDQVIIRVATLDEDPGQRPAAHIWVSEQADWLMDTELTRSFDKAPHGVF
ncbi:GFA family protein [Cupriavidus gilardii]|nr:GFA family protein [Cupriavidus gilardii]